jgi:hypothetical protein
VLRQFECEQEPIADIEYRESLWWEHASGMTLRMIESTFQTLGKDLSLGPNFGEDFGRHHQARRRLLIAELALQVFRAEHGREAHRLAELVPDVLPAVPLDPFTDQPLVYRPTEDVRCCTVWVPTGATMAANRWNTVMAISAWDLDNRDTKHPNLSPNLSPNLPARKDWRRD